MQGYSSLQYLNISSEIRYSYKVTYIVYFYWPQSEGDNVLGSPSVHLSVSAEPFDLLGTRLCRVRQRAKKSHYQSKVFVCVSNSRADEVDRFLILHLVYTIADELIYWFWYTHIYPIESLILVKKNSYRPSMITRWFFFRRQNIDGKLIGFMHSPKFIPLEIGIPSWIPNLGWNSKLNTDLNWKSKLNSWSVGRVCATMDTCRLNI